MGNANINNLTNTFITMRSDIYDIHKYYEDYIGTKDKLYLQAIDGKLIMLERLIKQAKEELHDDTR